MKKTSGKHKRGERGSLEEEDNVPKRCNMADSVGEVQILEATEPEPNLIDIEKMLVDIQATVAMILRKTKN